VIEAPSSGLTPQLILSLPYSHWPSRCSLFGFEQRRCSPSDRQIRKQKPCHRSALALCSHRRPLRTFVERHVIWLWWRLVAHSPPQARVSSRVCYSHCSDCFNFFEGKRTAAPMHGSDSSITVSLPPALQSIRSATSRHESSADTSRTTIGGTRRDRFAMQECVGRHKIRRPWEVLA
jgi:hypothetical protein